MASADRFAIDPALAALAADRRATARRPPAHIPMEKVRDAANSAMCRQPPGPPLFRVWDNIIAGPGGGTLTLRFYQPGGASPTCGILFIHGGGFALGNLETHDPQCRWLAQYSESLVVAVNYRLAPEHPAPAALDDCRAAWEWLTANDEPRLGPRGWALAGDSAGANLALSLALEARVRRRRPAALALFYPFLDPGCDSPSAHQLADGPGLSRDAMLWFWECYLRDNVEAAGLGLLHRDLAGLPSTSLFLASADPLVDEGLALAEALEHADVPLTCRLVEGMVHGFLHLAALTPKANETLRVAAGELRQALSLSVGDAWRQPD